MTGGTAAAPLYAVLAHLTAKKGSLKAPLRVSVEVTNECNQRCVFCCQSLPTRKGTEAPRRFSLEAFDALCRSFEASGVPFVSLTGGEPACHPEFHALVECVKRRDLSLAIETNGTLLTEADARWLGTVLEPERDMIYLSLDAAREETYRRLRGSPLFDAVQEALQNFKRYSVPFTVVTVLLRDNLDEVEEIRALAVRNGASGHRVGFPHRNPGTPAEIYLSAEEERNVPEWLRSPGTGASPLPCPAGLVSCAVDVCGRVAMCPYDLDTGASGRTIHERDFQELWLEVTGNRHALDARAGEGSRPACPLKAYQGLSGPHRVHAAEVS